MRTVTEIAPGLYRVELTMLPPHFVHPGGRVTREGLGQQVDIGGLAARIIRNIVKEHLATGSHPMNTTDEALLLFRRLQSQYNHTHSARLARLKYRAFRRWVRRNRVIGGTISPASMVSRHIA